MSKKNTPAKSKPKCAYCHHIGHNINKCKDPSIEILDKTIMEKFIFITVLFRTLVSHYEISLCVKELLNLLSYDELKILIYKKNLKKITINDDKNTYVHYLRINYQDKVCSYSNNELKQKLNEISDENYKIYGDEYLKTNVISDSFELEELLVNRMYEFRPPQRKFDITITQTPTTQTITKDCPICLDEIPRANQIITNCNHTFCNHCIQKYFKSLNSNIEKHPICAYCREPMKSLEIPDPTLCKQIQTKYCNEEQEQEHKLQIVIDNNRNIYREILVPQNPPPRPERPPGNPDRFHTSFISIFYQFIGF
uniref:RING-type domain-containing protein n=1 Tax=viral metagenome TaxID=1070528 RepID=A0A6C0DG68_9ZZZZ